MIQSVKLVWRISESEHTEQFLLPLKNNLEPSDLDYFKYSRKQDRKYLIIELNSVVRAKARTAPSITSKETTS